MAQRRYLLRLGSVALRKVKIVASTAWPKQAFTLLVYCSHQGENIEVLSSAKKTISAMRSVVAKSAGVVSRGVEDCRFIRKLNTNNSLCACDPTGSCTVVGIAWLRKVRKTQCLRPTGLTRLRCSLRMVITKKARPPTSQASKRYQQRRKGDKGKRRTSRQNN